MRAIRRQREFAADSYAEAWEVYERIVGDLQALIITHFPGDGPYDYRESTQEFITRFSVKREPFHGNIELACSQPDGQGPITVRLAVYAELDSDLADAAGEMATQFETSHDHQWAFMLSPFGMGLEKRATAVDLFWVLGLIPGIVAGVLLHQLIGVGLWILFLSVPASIVGVVLAMHYFQLARYTRRAAKSAANPLLGEIQADWQGFADDLAAAIADDLPTT